VVGEALKRETKKYAGPKGNLQFPLDEAVPYGLIGRVAKARARWNMSRKN